MKIAVRIFIMLLACVLMLGTLAACGDKTNDPEKETTTTGKEDNNGTNPDLNLDENGYLKDSLP